MLSIRARAFRMLLAYSASRARKNATLQERRAYLDNGARRLPLAGGMVVRRTAVGRMTAEWLVPDGIPDDRAILYLHGGGYTMGSCTTHRALVSRIATACRAPALLPEFRLAPEFPFPAALEDCTAAYRHLIDEGIPSHKIVIAGDSSGGGLAAALAVLLRDRGVPLPAALVCLSPWADLGLTGESLWTCAGVDPICTLEESRFHAAQYVGDHDPRSPLISPIYADLRGLPPMLIQVGDREILLSDAVRLADKARRDGVDTEIEVWEGMWHVWHMFAWYVPEGRRAVERVGAFVGRRLGSGARQSSFSTSRKNRSASPCEPSRPRCGSDEEPPV
jgi:monoterpene epsilon-lactone hydrolase